MKINSWFPAIVIAIVVLVSSAFLGTKVYKDVEIYRISKTKTKQLLFLTERIGSKSEWSNGIKLKDSEDHPHITSGVNKLKSYLVDKLNWSSRKSKIEEEEEKATLANEKAKINSYILLGIGIGAILLSLFLYLKSPLRSDALAFILIIIATCAFVVGIFVPMLEIETYIKDLTLPTEPIDLYYIEFQKVFEGKIYLNYVNKSIMHVVSVLLADGNYVIGLTILIFTIVVPLTKIVLTLLTIFSKGQTKQTVQFIIHKLAKWSMMDVFVVAIFLGFLSINSMDPATTFSQTMLGLYFFLAYCIISITSSYFLKVKK